MDKTTEIINLLRSMGYDGVLPETLNKICTNTTSFIWDQLLQNTKSRHEIENIRNNVIIHRLKKKPLNKQDEFSYSIKEISLFIEKQKLERRLTNKRLALVEKQNKVNNLSQSNKIQYIMIEKLDHKINQFEKREFLLEKKSEMLEQQIQDSEQLLSKNSGFAKPVQLEDIPNIKHVAVTLQENANEFKKRLCTVSLPDTNVTLRNKFFSTKKTNKTSVFEKYITMTASKSVWKTANKQDNYLKSQNKPENLRKCLFLESEEKPKRDSLGLLPLSCFEEEDDDNCANFLTTIKDNYTPLPNFNLNLPDNTLENLISDSSIREKLRSLLFTHNRHVIWNVLQKLSDDLHLEVAKNIHNQDNGMMCSNIQEDDISKIHLYHIQTEVKKIQNNFAINQMNSHLKKKKDKIKIDLLNRGISTNDMENIIKSLELILENVALDASLTAMKKEVYSAKSYEQNEDLQIVLKKVSQAKTNIIKKVNSINQYMSVAENTLQVISSSRSKTFSTVRKLTPFILDMDAIEPLTHKFNSKEIQVFEQFPLEYNRRCIYTDPSVYYHNICVDNFPVDRELDSDSLFMLTEILCTPFNPPEVILLNILRTKRKLDVLLTLRKEANVAESQKYSLEELEKQESYLQNALDRLNSLNCSSESTKTIAVGNNIKITLEIWHEMPYKDFISTSRLINGKDYKFYEKQYDNYFENL